MQKKKKSAIRLPLILIAVLVLLLAIAFGGFKLYDIYTEKQNQIASLEEHVASKEASLAEEQKQKAELEARLANEFSQGVNNGEEKVLNRIRQSIQGGTSVVETLRALYPDQLVVASGGTYHFIPINNALKRNSYSAENLVKQVNGELQYVQAGEVTSYKGIDVSKFQGTIDWKKVAADGVSFAYIRVGYRGYGENGTLVEDPCARDNLKGANNAGIATGVYFYTQATTIEEAKEEVRMVTDIIRGYRIDCPIVVDVERVSSASARMNQLDVKLRTDVVKAFCDEVIKAGYRPMIYHNLEMGAVLLDISKLEEYDKWFAYYNGDLYYPYDYKVLQYSDKGRVSGITGDVDLNIAFEPIWKSE
ncbi:MAG: glycoside hydrolase family 25 protein [Lachnospiraceae bacterium]|nr:glycoside hydrolase family 25 protein [Lachnospiraceae bacterium]